jgi:hypothetical protein
LLDWPPDSDMSRFDPRRRKYFLSRQTDCYCVAAKVKVANFSGLTFSEIAAAAASRRPHRPYTGALRRVFKRAETIARNADSVRFIEFDVVPWRTH